VTRSSAKNSILSIAIVFTVGSASAADPADEANVRFFETKVRPLLAERCFECHGPDQQWSGLRLDTREGLAKGGETGAAIVSGRPGESLLIRAVRHDADVEAMPPEEEGEKLTNREIEILSKWIAAGAVYPATSNPAPRKTAEDHWAFHPLGEPTPPNVTDTNWPQGELDRFILARLEAEQLAPAAPADRGTLLRRVTFDLTGLPPTPEELESFLSDEQPGAYERVVDRLLASSAYGERWGRHWLDVARYADSNGLDENIAHGNAWRYRDYVVRSFNEDKAYDRFLAEQLAGDLLPAPDESIRRENLIATGFLALGPKVLAEVDERKMEMDIVDEQVDTVGRALLGMTFGCARCHDHKFDPISTADYYGLAGIFKSTKTMESFTKIARWHENVLPGDQTRTLLANYETQKTELNSKISALAEAGDAQLAASGMAVPATPKEREALYEAETKTQLEKARTELAALAKSPPELPSAMGTAEGTIADVPIHLRGSHLTLGDVVPRHVPPAIAGPAAPQFSGEASGRLQLAQWITDPQHPLTARVIVNRVWRWHFGEGLVGTPDNFGLLGDEPSHPELLDWLARRFIESGWSMKKLHRLILLSSTYRQSDRPQPGVAERDPENRLLGRMPVRRLEAEEIRDALLATSGQLDRAAGGSLIAVKNREFFFDHTSKDLTTYASDRRSLYLPVVRNHVYDLVLLLDFPDPAVSSGDRASSTTAPQALLMMNSELVVEAASGLAARIAELQADDDLARIELLYRIAYSREPTVQEVEADLRFLSDFAAAPSSTESAWTALCQAVLSANEFVYVR
jgi:hypothetical protein